MIDVNVQFVTRVNSWEYYLKIKTQLNLQFYDLGDDAANYSWKRWIIIFKKYYYLKITLNSKNTWLDLNFLELIYSVHTLNSFFIIHDLISHCDFLSKIIIVLFLPKINGYVYHKFDWHTFVTLIISLIQTFTRHFQPDTCTITPNVPLPSLHTVVLMWLSFSCCKKHCRRPW